MTTGIQKSLFAPSELASTVREQTSTTFIDNMRLPVHRWIRYSAGFSAVWVQSVINESRHSLDDVRVFDPFAGSATTLIAAEDCGVPSYGIDSHPFVGRIARAKLARRSDAGAYHQLTTHLLKTAQRINPQIDEYPELIRRCFDDGTLAKLDQLRRVTERAVDGSPTAELAWLTLLGILRMTSRAGTANWQYVLPNKSKKSPKEPFAAYRMLSKVVAEDMALPSAVDAPHATFATSDARTCEGVPNQFATLVITSPPYPNNYDYADATRLEMTFFREIDTWGDLKTSVRQYLIRSCSQHVPEKDVNLQAVLSSPVLAPIRDELSKVCNELAAVRLTRGGKKTYHLMVACYFHDLAETWQSLRRVCASPCRVCFVVGDSAPYGVYVPVFDWLGKLALAAGFESYTFERTRGRNTKWKNRKHRVPLCEGRLWVDG